MTMAATAPAEKAASKTVVVLGFVFATLFTTVVGGGVSYWTGIESAKHQAFLEERSDRVNHFVTPAEEFNPLVVRFVAEVRAGRVTQPTKDAIKANLGQQFSALENARELLSAEEQHLADRYIEALVAADAGAKTSTGPLDSRAFIQASVEIATLRPALIEALRSS